MRSGPGVEYQVAAHCLFEGAHCLFEGMTDGERIAILLDMLGRKVRVVLDADAVEAI